MEQEIFNNKWRKYGLLHNPFFTNPLGDEFAPLEYFTGRIEEISILAERIESGVERIPIIGEPGVGKTSLINYLRFKARYEQYFTSSKEIDLTDVKTDKEILLLTLTSLYREIIKQKQMNTNFSFDIKLLNKLKKIFDFISKTENGELTSEQTNKENLIYIFEEIKNEILYGDNNNPTTKRYKKIIIHYDNLERITNTELLGKLLFNLRDFFQTKDVIFIFVGDHRLSHCIENKQQLNSIFSTPFIITNFELKTVEAIIFKRIEKVKAMGEIFINPIEKEVIKELFNLHKRNLRFILNSLSECILSTKFVNVPKTLTMLEVKDILYKKIAEKYLSNISKNEREIFNFMLKKEGEIFYPTQVAIALKKDKANTTNIYFRNLLSKGIITFVKKEDNKNYYGLTKEMVWYKLKPTEDETKQLENKEKDTSLNTFF